MVTRALLGAREPHLPKVDPDGIVGIRDGLVLAIEGMPSFVQLLSRCLPEDHPQKRVGDIVAKHTLVPAISFF